jgi:hypothetical protein
LNMNKLDEYAFWIMRAITEPDESERMHFYDKELNQLFSLSNKNNQLSPLYRNSFTENKEDSYKKFAEGINKVKRRDASIIQLPRLTFEEKKDFLNAYLSNVHDPILKDKLRIELNSFSKKDEFKFKADLKSLDKTFYLKEDMDRGKFIADKIREIYRPLGITEESEVVW